MEYHKTKDILYVKQLLGHKRIENTLIYTHLVNFDSDDGYTVRVASSLEEFTSLLESGVQVRVRLRRSQSAKEAEVTTERVLFFWAGIYVQFVYIHYYQIF